MNRQCGKIPRTGPGAREEHHSMSARSFPATSNPLDHSRYRQPQRLLSQEFRMIYSEVKREEMRLFHRDISPWEREHLLLNV